MPGGTFAQLGAVQHNELIFWGVSSSPANTEAFIESLAGHRNTWTGGVVTFTVNADGTKKIYVARPTHMGPLVFNVGSIDGGFILIATGISVTNSFGLRLLYDLYESVDAGVGSTTVTVRTGTVPLVVAPPEVASSGAPVLAGGVAVTAGVVSIAVSITSPSAGASLVVGTTYTVTGTISRPGIVTVKRGATILGSATVVGLAWSYSWTPVTGDLGSPTLNAVAVDTSNGSVGDAAGVVVLVLPANIVISGYTAFGVTEYAYKWDTKKTAVLTGSSPNQYVPGDQYARVVLDLPNGCGWIDIEAVATVSVSGSGDLGNTVDATIDGVIQDHTLQFTTSGVKQTKRLTVAGTGTRRVELYEQNCAITGLTPQTTATIIPAGAHASSCFFVGASGTAAYFPQNFDPGIFTWLDCWVGRVKASGLFGASYQMFTSGIGITGWGITSPATAATFVSTYVTPRMTGVTRKALWIEMMAGDMISAASTPTQWATRMGYLLDAAIAAHPTIEIKLQTSIVYGGTDPVSGFTMQNFRDVAPALATARPANVVIAVGYAGGALPAMSTTTGDLQDGAHMLGTVQRDKAWPYAQTLLTP